MKPKEILSAFFKGIEQKDLAAVKKFLPQGGPLAVVLSDGSVIDEAEDFIEFFEEWFEEEDWSIKHNLVHVEETSDMAYGVVDCEYTGKDEADKTYTVGLFGTAIIRRVEGKWQVVHFQQTEGEEI